MAGSVRRLSADGATPLPQYTWDSILSGLTQVIGGPVKFAIENNGTRTLGASPFDALVLEIAQLGTSDGYLYAELAADPDTISKPWGEGTAGAPSVSLSAAGAGGVWGATGEYGVKIVAVNATGKTIGSVEATFTIDVTTKKATYTWVQTPGATGYEVHRTATPGTYGASTLRATIGAGATITYEDNGSATGAGAVPVDNTTGGAGPDYGTAPGSGEFSDDDLVAGELAIEQQFFYWARLVVPPGTDETGNRRTFKTVPKEI